MKRSSKCFWKFLVHVYTNIDIPFELYVSIRARVNRKQEHNNPRCLYHTLGAFDKLEGLPDHERNAMIHNHPLEFENSLSDEEYLSMIDDLLSETEDSGIRDIDSSSSYTGTIGSALNEEEEDSISDCIVSTPDSFNSDSKGMETNVMEGIKSISI